MPDLTRLQWIPVTVTRILIGLFFLITGATKLFGSSARAEMIQTMESSHIPFPHASAVFASLVEFAAGAALMAGFFTGLSALLLGVDMVVAIATNRIHSISAHGVFNWLDDFLYLPEVLYVLILVWLMFAGPGRLSIDGLIDRRFQQIVLKRDTDV